MAVVLTGCGIQPPTEDLEKAKASIARAEEVEAGTYAAKEYTTAKRELVHGETNIVQEKSGQNKDAKEYLEISKMNADKAYSNAAPKYADHHVKELESALNKGKEVKADVAVKDEFKQANDAYNESVAALNKKDYKTAWTKAKGAKAIAEGAYQKAAEKKAKSEQAINDAQKSIEEVEKSATGTEGTEDTEGTEGTE